jgi:hypothetical protein
MTWVLIIGLTAGSGIHGVALHSVPGFVNEQQCMAAADAVRRSMGTETYAHVHLSCVSQGYGVGK